MRSPLSLVVLLAFSLSAASASADTIDQSVNTGPYNETGVVGLLTSNVRQFDPSLGTLNSITFSITGPYSAVAIPSIVTTPGDPGPFALLREFILENSIAASTVLYLPIGVDTGTLSFGLFGTDTAPADLGAAIGRGNTPINLEITLSSVADFSTTGPTETVGYNYTPAAVLTPEPSSIALLGSGLLGVAGIVRRRRA